MDVAQIPWGVRIDHTFLSAQEALTLLDWLMSHREELEQIRWQPLTRDMDMVITMYSPHGQEWNQADEEEMRSEDEQIACFCG